jgi:hypothetical protein
VWPAVCDRQRCGWHAQTNGMGVELGSRADHAITRRIVWHALTEEGRGRRSEDSPLPVASDQSMSFRDSDSSKSDIGQRRRRREGDWNFELSQLLWATVDSINESSPVPSGSNANRANRIPT